MFTDVCRQEKANTRLGDTQTVYTIYSLLAPGVSKPLSLFAFKMTCFSFMSCFFCSPQSQIRCIFTLPF